MPAQYTTRNRLTQQEIGSNENIWGDILNEVLQLVDDSLDGIIPVDITLGNDTLTFLNGGPDEARCRVIFITNNFVGNRQVIIPDTQKLYFVSVTNGVGATTTIRNSSDMTGVTITGLSTQTAILCDGSTTQTFLGGSLLAANNLSDLPDKAVSRTNLDVYSKAEIDTGAFGGYPIGAITAWPTSIAPVRHVVCNGQAISRTTYAALFAVIGTTFGFGDGSTTFNVPDLRGEFIRGWDNGRGIDPSRAIGSAQSDLFRSHTHGYVAGAGGGNDLAVTGGSTRRASQNYVTDATGGTETRPRNVALNYVIYTGVV